MQIEAQAFEQAVYAAARKPRGKPASSETVTAARLHLVEGLRLTEAAAQAGISRQRAESYTRTLLTLLGHEERIQRVPKKSELHYSAKTLAKKAGAHHLKIAELIHAKLIPATIIKRAERTLYQIKQADGDAFVAATLAQRGMPGHSRPTQYPKISSAQFATALHQLYLSGSVRSENWMRGAWLVLVKGCGVVEAAQATDISKGGLTRPLKALHEAFQTLDAKLAMKYSSLFGEDTDLESVLPVVRNEWLTVREQRIIGTKAKRSLNKLAEIGAHIAGLHGEVEAHS